ncbi:MAG: hypothetical protein ACYDAM_04265 [Leptospirales bacterium]
MRLSGTTGKGMNTVSILQDYGALSIFKILKRHGVGECVLTQFSGDSKPSDASVS